MGSCITSVKILPNEGRQPQTGKNSTELSKHPTFIAESKKFTQLISQKDQLSAVITTLEALKAKLETQGKALIKKHKRGRSLFALKRLRLYTNFIEDVQNQINMIDQAIVGKGDQAVDIQQVSSDSLVLLGEIREILKLESPLHEKETLKEREEKFKPLFKKHHIQNTDVYVLFAQYEAEVNDITLTTSTVFKKSESNATTQPNSQNNLDEAYQGSYQVSEVKESVTVC